MARRALGPAALQVVQAVRQVLAGERRPVVVACSGGADSMALACAVAHLARRGCQHATASAAVIDHGLQPASSEVAAEVANRLNEIGLAVTTRRVNVAADSPDGMEAAARDARYAALAEVAGAEAVVLLGHTLDDQAETVLLGLARGSGTRSLAGMPAQFGRSPQFIRPLLGLRRTTTAQACGEWGAEVWSDPQNDDPTFTRVRVRQRVLPMLETELGPGITEALARTATMARQDADALDGLADSLVPAAGEGLAAASLRTMPEAIASRVLRRWLVDGGVDQPSYANVQAVKALVDDWHGQLGVDLPGGIRVLREAGTLVLGRTPHAVGLGED